MARNKHPEVTVEKILDTAQRLFLEKGYENTTIQDIVDNLGGLTKGAVYHHFNSKEEIIDAVSDRMFFANNPFDAVVQRSDLNSLQKIQNVLLLNFADKERMNINFQSLPLMKNPRILVDAIKSNQDVVSPMFFRLLIEGNQDGSLSTAYPRELAEVFTLLLTLWLSPAVFPASSEEITRKFQFLADMTRQMGVPIINEEILTAAQTYIRDIEEFVSKNL